MKENNTTDLIRNVAVTLVTAPFKLHSNVSKHIVYLPRDVISHVLLGAIFVDLTLMLLTSICSIYMGTFSLLKGKMPLIIFIVALIILVYGHVYFKIGNFDVYDHVDMLLPIGNSGTVAEEQTGTTESVEGSVNEAVQESNTNCTVDKEEADNESDNFSLQLQKEISKFCDLDFDLSDLKFDEDFEETEIEPIMENEDFYEDFYEVDVDDIPDSFLNILG